MLTANKVVFLCVYTSYFLNVLVKKSVTFALPEIEKSEGLDKNQMGLIMSIQLLGYAGSKFICGVLIDWCNPQVVLGVGLVLQGVTAVAFANVNGSFTALTLFWLLNGVCAGTGWPASINIIKKIFRKDQMGTAWSILSTSMNIAGMVGPLITAYIITRFEWRTSISLPGFSVIILGPMVYFVLNYSCRHTLSQEEDTAKTTDGNQLKGGTSRLELFKLPGYNSILITYVLISLVQYGMLQWVPVYLVNDLGHSIITGNTFTSAFEVGGVIGSLIAGYYSDYLLSKITTTANSTVRQYVVGWFTSGLVVCLALLTWVISSSSSLFTIMCVAFGIGVTIYGPVSILGVAALECAPNNLSSLALSVCSLLVSLTQSSAGLPLGFIIKQFGWNVSFYLQLFISIAITVHLFYFTRDYKYIDVTTNKKEQ